MKPSGIQINKPVMVMFIGIIILVIVGYRIYRNPTHFTILQDSTMEKLVDVPADSKEKAKSVKVKEVTVKVKVDGKEVDILTRQTDPSTVSPQLDLLLLHGQKFTSENWADIQTLQLLSVWNYRPVAVDLPGYGKSKSAAVKDNVAFMEELIQALKLNAPVIISPSMSGEFSLPYLFKDPSNVLIRSKAYIPVAPVYTDKYDKKLYEQLKIPTAIIYGQKDETLGTDSKENLKNLPGSKLFMIEGAGHAAYLDKPDKFHQILYSFLLEIAKK
ncbi:hypothetical protein CHS0354_017811 [Potamilus streckersoni]|uniref:Protein ABHD14A n=1 Tax=Potamilus streckersoni TaxID=2493646 RepID=A0AAE0T9R2_9BIVA|nr:hypothetical protein CHS0354_017811 [Potamilus streckersoni]